MISVGIDVAKDKHDCFIINSEGVVLADVFTIPNSMEGFTTLLDKLRACSAAQDSIKVGLEATGHYSYNILGFLLDNGLATYVLNPLRTNLYRKSLSLRKTKTDRVDARTIATMLLSDVGLKPYTDTAYHNEELKSLTRYRFDKVKERAKLKQSISRLVCILFPELEELVPTLHSASVYALLAEFPGAKQIAPAHLSFLAVDQDTGNAILFCVIQRVFRPARFPVEHRDHHVGVAYHPLVSGLVGGAGKGWADCPLQISPVKHLLEPLCPAAEPVLAEAGVRQGTNKFEPWVLRPQVKDDFGGNNVHPFRHTADEGGVAAVDGPPDFRFQQLCHRCFLNSDSRIKSLLM